MAQRPVLDWVGNQLKSRKLMYKMPAQGNNQTVTGCLTTGFEAVNPGVTGQRPHMGMKGL